MSKGVSTEWLKGKSAEEQKEFEQVLRHSTLVLGKLKEILDDKLTSMETAEVKRETYENPSFAYWQAHVNGRRAALKEINQLLSFLDN